MTGFPGMVFGVRILLTTIPKYYKSVTSYFNMEKVIQGGSASTGRKIDEDVKDTFPNKKLCIEKNFENESQIQKKGKKRNVAMLIAYYGENYWGMQVNPNTHTIEGVLLKALEKANLIPSEAVNDVHLIHFQRAARTDKGVSAAKQVVSMKISGNEYDIKNVNSHLPEDVRVLSIKRVTKGFNSKNECTARTYSYTLPTFAFAPELHEEYPENYRINKEALENVNTVLSSFLGTRNFHNFTSRKSSSDPSAKRYILNFKTEEPFVVDGKEFITLKVKGQSFMLHQIRKMIGFTIAILKGVITNDIQTEVWKSKKLPVPTAPGLGLVLENVHYDRYNRKFGSDGMHEPLTWDELADDIENFRKKYILGNIIEKENANKLMFEWICQSIPKYQSEVKQGDLEVDTKEEISNSESVENCIFQGNTKN